MHEKKYKKKKKSIANIRLNIFHTKAKCHTNVNLVNDSVTEQSVRTITKIFFTHYISICDVFVYTQHFC